MALRPGLAPLLLALLLVTGCAPASSVPWKDYAAGLQAKIDATAAAKDCRALQAEFNAADANNTATRNRTGHGNVELMNYIDAALRGAGCYAGR